MLFPIAGIECNPFIPPLVAMIISFVASMGGLSGAFLLLPFQMTFLGYTNPSVSATNQFYNIIAIPSGVYRFIKEGRMLWPLTFVVAVGTLPGVFLGAVIRITWLPDPTNFKLFAALVLFYIGAKIAKDLIYKGSKKSSAEKNFQESSKNLQNKSDSSADLSSRIKVLSYNIHKVEYEFYGEKFSFPVRGVFALTFIVGIVGGIYGIGGGAIIAPFFISYYGLPVYTVAGASLMGTFITSVAAVGFYIMLAPYYPDLSITPDWTLGLLLGVGGMVGMYLGAYCQKFVPAKYIKILLSTILICTAIQYTVEYFK